MLLLFELFATKMAGVVKFAEPLLCSFRVVWRNDTFVVFDLTDEATSFSTLTFQFGVAFLIGLVSWVLVTIFSSPIPSAEIKPCEYNTNATKQLNIILSTNCLPTNKKPRS